ncbi:UNKNOWN [Stylonychia lemnae]|uniref:Potassium channel tetramerisation-type BTB domain-containing protein n=1 Tax=Stylonychia lemnae TaxID=5949 RepID=A0A078B3X0_STYLE|nr:UNKNOWN [Stylonychia lemnae]|eukprot:CDW88213.1 UNKNOWN [Stylonychia lemnae]
MSGIIEFDVGGVVVKTIKDTISRFPKSKLHQILLKQQQLQSQHLRAGNDNIAADQTLRKILQTSNQEPQPNQEDQFCQEGQQNHDFIEIFIDHNPKRFTRVIDCLRDGEIPSKLLNKKQLFYLQKDLQTFGPFEGLKHFASNIKENQHQKIYTVDRLEQYTEQKQVEQTLSQGIVDKADQQNNNQQDKGSLDLVDELDEQDVIGELNEILRDSEIQNQNKINVDDNQNNEYDLSSNQISSGDIRNDLQDAISLNQISSQDENLYSSKIGLPNISNDKEPELDDYLNMQDLQDIAKDQDVEEEQEFIVELANSSNLQNCQDLFSQSQMCLSQYKNSKRKMIEKQQEQDSKLKRTRGQQQQAMIKKKQQNQQNSSEKEKSSTSKSSSSCKIQNKRYQTRMSNKKKDCENNLGFLGNDQPADKEVFSLKRIKQVY